MKTDRELLALASKAAGIKGLVWGVTPDICMAMVPVEQRTGGRQCWNPLENDGDALRLAVRLKFSIYADDEAYVFVVSERTGDENETGMCECWNADPQAATRRAIVRAAAAIGEAMP